jgi:hypothetical protein
MQTKSIKTPPAEAQQTGVIHHAADILHYIGEQIFEVKHKVGHVSS